MILSEELRLPLARDPQVYGALRAVVLIDGEPAKNKRILVESHEVTTDHNGRFELFVPLEQQKKVYHLSTLNSQLSTLLYAPCGKNDIVLL